MNDPAKIRDEISQWIQGLPDAQRYIFTYILRTRDVEEACSSTKRRFFKRDEQEPEAENERAFTDSDTDLPVDQQRYDNSENVKIENVCALQNVNALQDGASIEMSENLTIIFGRNGSGKTGYFRLLAKGVNSRTSYEILPNVTEDKTGQPKGQIQYRFGNSIETHEIPNENTSSALQKFLVFDTKAANIHITENNEVEYTPPELTIFDDFLEALMTLDRERSQIKSTLQTQNPFENFFENDTAISRFCLNLSRRTHENEIHEKLAFTESDSQRLNEILEEMASLNVESIELAVKRLNKDEEDLREFLSAVRTIKLAISISQLKTIENKRHKIEKLKQILEQEGLEKVKLESIFGIGTPEWYEFANGAYSLGRLQEHDYPAKGDVCLLCSQPLTEDSVNYIRHIWIHLKSETKSAISESENEIKRYLEKLESLPMETLNQNRAEVRALVRYASNAQELTRNFRARADKLRSDLISDLDVQKRASEVWVGDSGVTRAILEALKQIRSRRARLQSGEYKEHLEKLESEKQGLHDKRSASRKIDEAICYLRDVKFQNKIDKIDLKSTRVSTKQKQIFEEYVGTGYLRTFSEVSQRLAPSAPPVTLKTTGRKGATLRKLVVKGNAEVKSVLSEGEQRCVALADFLTEVSVGYGISGIILDDPTIALDNDVKRRLAEILSEFAADQQVMIFTHDIVFVSALMSTRASEKIHSRIHQVEKTEKAAGTVVLDEAPTSEKTYKTTHKAIQNRDLAKKAVGEERQLLIARSASALRNTIEYFIAHKILGGVVQRWDEHIRVGNLEKLRYDPALAKEAADLHKEASRLIDAHSTSDEFAGQTASLDELNLMIEKFQQLEEKQKQLGKP